MSREVRMLARVRQVPGVSQMCSGRIIFSLAAALVAHIAPATACPIRSSETWVFTESPPAKVTDGLVVLEVEVPASVEKQSWGMVEVKVVKTVLGERYGLHWMKVLQVSPGLESSCSRWGVTGKRAFLTGVFTADKDRRRFFAAIQRRLDADEKAH